MFKDYYDCPADYRKSYWKIIVEAIGRIIGGAIAVAIMLFLLVAFS